MMYKEKDQIKIGLRAVGLRPVYDSLMAQIGTAEVRTVSYAKGTTLEWMFFRRNGNGPLRIDNMVVWESETPFVGFEFDVDHEGQRYTFTVPMVCGNFALLKSGDIPVVAAVTPAPPPTPMEKVQEPPVAAAPVVVPEKKTFGFIADLGYYRQFDPANYLLVRGGVEKFLGETTSIAAMIGAAPKLDGTDGTSAIVLDVFFNVYMSSVYMGVGIGGWITDGDTHELVEEDSEDSDVDLILNLGAKVYEKPDAMTLSVFLEARSAFDELDEAKEYGYFGGGLRFQF